MWESGSGEKLTDLACMSGSTEIATKVNFCRISNTAKVPKNSFLATFTRALFPQENLTGTANTIGLRAVSTKASSLTVTDPVMACGKRPAEEPATNTKATTSKTRSRATVFTHGWAATFTKETTTTIFVKGTVKCTGSMAVTTKESGGGVTRRERECFTLLKMGSGREGSAIM